MKYVVSCYLIKDDRTLHEQMHFTSSKLVTFIKNKIIIIKLKIKLL